MCFFNHYYGIFGVLFLSISQLFTSTVSNYILFVMRRSFSRNVCLDVEYA